VLRWIFHKNNAKSFKPSSFILIEKNMASRIPKSIQEKVIRKWLEGKTRDANAQECKISGGSVSSIVQWRRRKDREFDLMREVAVELRRLGITVESFAPLIRCRQLIKAEYSDSSKSVEEEEENMDALIEALSVFCFRQKKTAAEFGNMVQTLYHAADKYGIELSDLPAYINELNDRADASSKKIDILKSKEERLLKHYRMTVDVIKDIISRGPFMLGAYYDMKASEQEAKEEKRHCKDRLLSLQFEIKAQKIKAAKKGP
jgi:hypothetical protein